MMNLPVVLVESQPKTLFVAVDRLDEFAFAAAVVAAVVVAAALVVDDRPNVSLSEVIESIQMKHFEIVVAFVDESKCCFD